MDKIKTIQLGSIANYSDDRISFTKLSPDNYIGTDNLLQNKLGKTRASYTPKTGLTAGYEKGDILIGNIRPYLKKIWYATSNGGSSADVLTLKVKKDNDSKFVYYSLFRDDFFDHMMKGSKGTKMPRGDKSQVLDFLIPDFDLTKQKKITEALSSIDSKIGLNNSIFLELEAITKTLYSYWFVQFDFPSSKGKPYKTSEGKMIWNEELKRHIPKGWECKSLGDICEIYQPQTISEKEMSDDGEYLVFGANGVVGKYSKYNHEDSEIVITCRGNTCGNIIRTYPYSWITGNAMVIKPRSNSIHNEFIYCALQFLNVKRTITGSAQPQITRTNLSPLKIVLPHNEILKLFLDNIKPNVLKRLQIIKENQKLSELRDWLLPMLMNGQIKVK